MAFGCRNDIIAAQMDKGQLVGEDATPLREPMWELLPKLGQFSG
jgi:hypothetical protein